MEPDSIKVIEQSLDTCQSDGILFTLPKPRLITRLQQYLQDLPKDLGKQAQLLLRDPEKLPPGSAIQTVAPEYPAGSITWLPLTDTTDQPSPEQLTRQLKYGLQYLERDQKKVILIGNPRNLEVFHSVENGIVFWKQTLADFPSTRISRIMLCQTDPPEFN